jgi:Domain of Unknown Function (DUF1080)
MMIDLRYSLIIVLLTFGGCSEKKQPVTSGPVDSKEQPGGVSQAEAPPVTQEEPLDLNATTGEVELAAYELQADKILSAALSPDQLEEGWVRLFDGHTLAGCSIIGNADWRCKDGVIRVTRGEPSFLVTNFDIADFELKVDFRCAPTTNSGIFLRTAPEPGDVGLDCLELNIAPPDNPYPTGSFVKRQKYEPKELGEFDSTKWHTFHVRLVGESVTVSLDGKPLYELIDETSSRRGYISLQHNKGVVEFRNVLLRPIESKPLKLAANWQEDWVSGEKEPGTLKLEPSDKGLRVQGGLGKVQSKESFGDFWLQAKYTLAKSEVNTGIFFRCIEESMLDGYECQVNHAVVGGDPLAPKDAGSGGIFRRKPARIVVGDGTKPTHISLLASGSQFVTWVNGIMTAEFEDDRPADPNPRKGTRLEAGPIAIQGHDSTTDVIFHSVKVSTLR